MTLLIRYKLLADVMVAMVTPKPGLFTRQALFKTDDHIVEAADVSGLEELLRMTEEQLAAKLLELGERRKECAEHTEDRTRTQLRSNRLKMDIREREDRIRTILGRPDDQPDPLRPFQEIDALITRLAECGAIADKLKAGQSTEGLTVKPLNTPVPSCNMHDDCSQYPKADHCRDENCPDCFGQ